MLDRLVAAALLITFVACAHPIPREPVPVAVAPVKVVVAPEAPPVAVIALSEKQSVDLSADGSMIDVKRTTRLAVGGRIFTLKSEAVDDTYVCDVGFISSVPFHSEGKFHTEGLSLLDPSGRELVLVEKGEKTDQKDAVMRDEQNASIVAAVGPYVFVRRERHYFGCGANIPIFGHETTVWDVQQRKQITFRAPTTAFEKAAGKLAGRGFDHEDVTFAEATPHFDTEGHLSVTWRFEKPARYIEGDGVGSAATVSAIIESTELPEELAAYRDPPPAIRNYLANGGEPILGWTALD